MLYPNSQQSFSRVLVKQDELVLDFLVLRQNWTSSQTELYHANVEPKKIHVTCGMFWKDFI